MTDKQERIASKVRKLLAIAEDDAASAEEIQNAMNFAAKLMDAHHLTEEDLAHEPIDDYKKADQSAKGESRSFVGRKFYAWESYLAHFISKFVGCPCYMDNAINVVRSRYGIAQRNDDDSLITGKSIVFYGIAEDAMIAKELYDELRKLIATMAVVRHGTMYSKDGGMYAQGFVSGLCTQLETSKKLEQKSGTTAMILVARRDDLIKYKEKLATNWLAEEKGIKKIRKAQRKTGAKGSYNAYAEGKADGSRTDVSFSRTKKITS